VFALELVVEALGHAFHVEPGLGAGRHVPNCQLVFFVQAEGDGLELLDQRLARLARGIGVLPAERSFALLAANPLPDLRRFGRIHIDNNVFVSALLGLALDLAPQRVRRNLSVGHWRALKRRHTALVRYRR
jgi:hypothetical protein